MYDTAAYFTEHEEDSIRGFTIIETDDEQYHIAEKWQRDDGTNTWLDYWIEADALTDRIEAGACEHTASLSTEQFEDVCAKISWEPADLNQDVLTPTA